MSNVNRKKDFSFKVVVSFTICEDIQGLVDEKDYKPTYEVGLEERQYLSCYLG